MFVYKRATNLYTVGYYEPESYWDNGIPHTQYNFISESDHSNPRDAAARCSYLNGGTGALIAS